MPRSPDYQYRPVNVRPREVKGFSYTTYAWNDTGARRGIWARDRAVVRECNNMWESSGDRRFAW
jgi:hypothetical protein